MKSIICYKTIFTWTLEVLLQKQRCEATSKNHIHLVERTNITFDPYVWI